MLWMLASPDKGLIKPSTHLEGKNSFCLVCQPYWLPPKLCVFSLVNIFSGLFSQDHFVYLLLHPPCLQSDFLDQEEGKGCCL